MASRETGGRFHSPDSAPWTVTILAWYNTGLIFEAMAWEIEGTDEFVEWFESLDDSEKSSVITVVDLLEEKGPHLGFPYTSDVRGSDHGHLRELRIQHAGEPYRVLYAWDPRRTAILLLGGVKTGDDRWYLRNISIADRLYDEHLRELRMKGLIK